MSLELEEFFSICFQVQQLRTEKKLPRKPMSQTIPEMIRFMEQHASKDHLLKGFAKPSDNPFQEKSRCVLL